MIKKKTILGLAAVAVLAAGIGLSARGMGMGCMMGSPAKCAKMMQEELGLDKAQADKLEKACAAHRKEMKDLMRKAEDAREELAEKVEKKAKEAELKKALDAVKASQKAVMESIKAQHEAIAKDLSVEQQAKLALMGPGGMGCMMGGPGMGHPGMGDGKGRGHGMGKKCPMQKDAGKEDE